MRACVWIAMFHNHRGVINVDTALVIMLRRHQCRHFSPGGVVAGVARLITDYSSQLTCKLVQSRNTNASALWMITVVVACLQRWC